MKNIYLILFFSLFTVNAFAQQATEIDSKFVKLPRYANLSAITTAITTPLQGMMVYNSGTGSNWVYNGTEWVNLISSNTIVAPLSLTSSTTTTITGMSSAVGAAGLKGVTSNINAGFGVWGLSTITTPAADTYGIYGQNNSTTGNGVGVAGVHLGTGWAGTFNGINALKSSGHTFLDGNVSISNSNFLEFGKGIIKQVDNGKIAYHAFGEANTLSIVGGGIEANGSDRKIKLWADGGTIFSGGASFDKGVNIGNFNLEPTAKLQVSSNATSEFPSMAIIDDSPNNQNGGIFQFRNQLGTHKFDIQGLFGLQSTPFDSFLSFNKNGNPIMRLKGSGSLGLGVLDPSETLDLVGNIKLNGEILPGGTSGTVGQVLSSNGDGTMKWDDASSFLGQIIEVSPSIADTAVLRTKGFGLVGNKTQTVNRNGIQLGNVVTHPNNNQLVDSNGEIFYSSALNKLFIVYSQSNKITTFDLADATYGNKQDIITANYDLANTKAHFTGTKILIYPFFVFDCASGTTSTFPSNPCSGVTVTPSQVWTGTKLIVYGPTFGFTYTLSTNTYTCIQAPGGNVYYPKNSTTWTGSVVVFYGGYLTVSGNKVSVDIGVTYNPNTNVWDDIAAGGPRIHGHNAVWTGTEILITGGTRDTGTDYGFSQDNTYNPTTFSWNTGYTPNMQTLRTKANTKSIVSNNKIFYFNVAGGTEYSKLFNYYFNIPSKTWVLYTTPFKHTNGTLNTSPVAISNTILYFSNMDARCSLSAFGHILETTTPYIMPAWNANIFTNLPKVNNNQYLMVMGNLGAAWLYNSDNSRWTKTSSTNLPTDRTSHIVKAIGGSNKFLVWGGVSGSTFLRNGAIYNATNNTWTAMSTSNAPTENLQCAMGDGTAMFWGTNSGKIYNIVSDSWTNISTTNAPVISGTIMWYDFKYIHVSNSGIKYYIPSTNTWLNGNSEARPGQWTGKYIVGGGLVFNAETEELKKLDFTDIDNYLGYNIIRVYDENSLVFIEDNTKAEVLNLSTGVVKFLPINITSSEPQNSELFKVSSTKYLLLGNIKTSTCDDEYLESIKFLDNTTSSVIEPLNLKTLVYKKK
jgi:hypothetical protein